MGSLVANLSNFSYSPLPRLCISDTCAVLQRGHFLLISLMCILMIEVAYVIREVWGAGVAIEPPILHR